MNRRQIWVALGIAGLVGIIAAGLFFYWPHRLDPVAASPMQPRGDALLARGEYLANAADCGACHTIPGGKPFAGGLAFKLPFGTIYSPNITPDRRNGIGAWSDAEFVRAMRSGVGRHGEDLYPAFPYTSYALLSTDDILAIKAYLASLKPIDTPAPANALLFPFNQRPVMRAWKLLFLTWHPFTPDNSRSAAWNRGAYLVEGLAHCGECHTPRNLMFARKQGQALAGGDVDGWKAWNITSDPDTGIGRWSDADIASYLSTGHANGHGAAAAGMRQAVDLSLSKLTPADIDAMVRYLRSVPARSTDVAAQVNPTTAAMRSSTPWSPGAGDPKGLGRRIFEGACASCHAWTGAGQQIDRAALAGDHAVNDPAGANVIAVILEGSRAEKPTPATTMPAFAAAYSDAEIAAVANYVIAHFGGKDAQVTPKDVARQRKRI
jgi:mono/diheme cytochrome c family protein